MSRLGNVDVVHVDETRHMPPREQGRRLVRHGMADVLAWLGEDVGPPPGPIYARWMHDPLQLHIGPEVDKVSFGWVSGTYRAFLADGTEVHIFKPREVPARPVAQGITRFYFVPALDGPVTQELLDDSAVDITEYVQDLRIEG